MARRHARWATSTPSSLPGGFAHGDYLRPGAIARSQPGHGRGRRVRRRRRARRRHLQRLPGADRGRPAARRAAEERGSRFLCAPAELGRRQRRNRRSPAPANVGEVLRLPINHFEGNYTVLGRDARASCGPRTGSCSAMCDNPNGSIDDIAGVCSTRPQRGRPHAPPRAGLRPAARLRRRPAPPRLAARPPPATHGCPA